MLYFDLSTPAGQQQFAERISDLTARRFAELTKTKEPEHITFAEAMEKLGVGHEALRNRLQDAGVRTYRFGRGKAFDRKHFYKLKT